MSMMLFMAYGIVTVQFGMRVNFVREIPYLIDIKFSLGGLILSGILAVECLFCLCVTCKVYDRPTSATTLVYQQYQG